MAIVDLPIANGQYISDSLPISAQQCVNWYPNIPQAPALSKETLLGTPGIIPAGSTGDLMTDANRGSHALDGTPYFVNGTGLYRVNRVVVDDVETFPNELIGTIEGVGRVSMADNGTQLMILIPRGRGYIFTESPDTLTEITDPDFTANGPPLYVTFIDGYFCCTTDPRKFIISALNDGLAWDALDFGTAESSPDNVVVPIVFKNQLFIGGARTFEAFTNIGGSGFPFKRSGLFLDEGVRAPFSAVLARDTFMFIGGGGNESPAIWSLQGNMLHKVSTTAIDSILQRFTREEVESAFAWSYAQKGAYFVGFSLPTTCLVYDLVTQRWHERRSIITNPDGTTEIVRSRVNSITRAYGRLFVGDSQDGRIGVLDVDEYEEYGSQIVRVVSTQPFSNNRAPFFVPYLELTVESGVGNAAAPDPVVRQDISTDGGKTWGSDRTRPLGRIGEYNRRAIWRRNGNPKRFAVYRYTMSDPVKPVIVSLTGDIRAAL